MQESTDGKQLDNRCMDEQREFLKIVSELVVKYSNVQSVVDEVDSRLTKEIREIREENKEVRKDMAAIDLKLTSNHEEMKPMLAAYEKGMTIKSKLGNIAMAYIMLSFLFPKISPSAIIGLIKLAI